MKCICFRSGGFTIPYVELRHGYMGFRSKFEPSVMPAGLNISVNPAGIYVLVPISVMHDFSLNPK
jgi:hypothetical protein